MDYKDTLLMPKTEFQMRGNLGVRELEFQQKWEEMDLYNKVLLKHQNDKPFILHDGPPFANGDAHIGHALNKILKDFVLRYKTMSGHYVRYIPGWDTHGLPIETALAKNGVKRNEISLIEYRNLCRSYAEEQINIQREQFIRMGILGEWSNPYITYTNDYEARQVKIFAEMVKKGLIYKGLKPVFWSPTSETALAEAEIEYMDKTSISIYVAFPAVSNKELFMGANYIIWTTTPWTIPANLAISVHPRFDYVLFQANNKKYIVAKSLYENVLKELNFNDAKILDEFKGETLKEEKYIHPIYNRLSPILLGEHVTDEDGTGLVHTAPGHGEDDYKIGREYGLDILCPVDDKGFMTEEAGIFNGMYYEKANLEVVRELDRLNVLLKEEEFIHSYPHDWRTKKPVIFRATPQWFASIDKLKNDLLMEVKKVNWIPKWGETRISNMIANRDDWCISRQRAWGVPLPIFYAENGEPILDEIVLEHVVQLFLEHGSNVWYEKDAIDLLPKGYKNVNSPNNIYTKETDIMDVWFDSGTSHSVLDHNNLGFPSDLYLEGSDQYRGWFNSSLITSVAAFNKAPYKTVVSHGFVLDGKGKKMSKSLGNAVDPNKVMKQQGADLLRLWVATVDYQSDVRISDDLVKQIAEGYRKIRNTIRYMLGNLDGFDPSNNYNKLSDRKPIHKAFMMRFYKVQNECLNAYESYEFDKVYRHLVAFITNELSAFYLDYTKDILYIEKADDKERRDVQSSIYDVLLATLKLLTPLIPHTTSEAYDLLPFEKLENVYLENMPAMFNDFDKNLMNSYDVFMNLREVVLKKLEDAREDKTIGKSLQAELDISATKKELEAINNLELNLKQVLIVSKAHIKEGAKTSINVKAFNGHTCDRCWNIYDHINEDNLCERCEKVLEK